MHIELIALDKLLLYGSFRVSDILPVVESIKSLGYQMEHENPILASEEFVDGSPHYHVRDGNRRVLALRWIRDNDPLWLYRRVLPNGMVPVKVSRHRKALRKGNNICTV